MSADLESLNIEAPVLDLLTQYSPAGPDDRERWRDRVMEWPGVTERELTRWHGMLVAAGLIEQNTGQTPAVAAGQVNGCYRLTQAGRRAVRKLVSI